MKKKKKPSYKALLKEAKKHCPKSIMNEPTQSGIADTIVWHEVFSSGNPGKLKITPFTFKLDGGKPK